ncbi:MAG: phosphoheptose isomerase [Acidobacteriota bacterium]
MKPLRFLPWDRRLIWGSTDLDPWFGRRDKRIGEVWHLFPILTKFIFASERLSIQVHPDDDYAWRHEGQWGKTEMWYVLRAEPGAQIALGFRETITRERFRQAALSGEIKELVQWIPIQAGDTFFIPPGTVHAIGPGAVLCEIQQNCDLTYRIYDYGRGRDLHVDKATDVAFLGPHPGRSTPVDLGEGRKLLASCKYFATELIEAGGPLVWAPDEERFHLLIVIEGRGRLGDEPFHPGECWLIPATAAPFRLDVDGAVRLLKTYVPEP